MTGALAYNVDSKLRLAVEVKQNTQTEKLRAVLGGSYKLNDKTDLKGKLDQNLKATFLVKYKHNDRVTANVGLQVFKFKKGKERWMLWKRFWSFANWFLFRY